MDDRVMALCELANDLLFHKIPADKVASYVDRSLAAGRTVAEELRGWDILELYKQHDIAIVRRQKAGKSFGVMLRGQAVLGRGGCSVELYEESIHALADGEELDTATAERIHLAHEFFHFWEYRRGRTVAEQLGSVETVRFLGFSRRANINRCSEVAAHMFAKTLLGLRDLPNLFDYRYMIRTGSMTQEQLDEKFSAFQAQLQNCDRRDHQYSERA